jgi:arginyl-tRNA synthetase
VYHTLEARIRTALREFIRQKYGVEARVAIERPPKIELGEAASPVAFELARPLKRAPRQIAQEIAAALPPVGGVARWEVAGGGYLNAYFDRSAFFSEVMRRAGREAQAAPADAPKVIVEHTNINPNKAAHIGHLRNAALGDSFVRLLRHAGRRVEVQNYIDNTGVQVADVVVAFLRLEKKTLDDVRARAAGPRFDYYCWDLYARVTQWFEEDKSRLELRAATLKAIEEGHGAEAEMAELVATAIVRRHLETMERLGVEYDVLPRESEILHLKFWDAAFRLLKERGAIELATAGKNAGCWVMRMSDGGAGESEGENGGDDDGDTKIIVRSNGTVTYVGKDIAYQLWKFGLLERDFRYARFHTHPSGRVVWVSTSGAGEPEAPQFGRGAEVYNVIDSRQAYLQSVVIAGLKALGYTEQAARSTHFSYEMVALSKRCAEEMGYAPAPGEEKKAYVEVSGRRGTGVKADDLLDRLVAAARAEVDARSPDDPAGDRERRAQQIAIGALRYYLLKYTRTTVVAFDFKDALSFEGETGPYCQYAIVRARNIWRKRSEQAAAERGRPPEDASFFVVMEGAAAAPFLASPENDEIWELVLLAGSLGAAVEAAIGAQEPAFVAKYAFQLAQAFNNFYHKHHILSETDEARQLFLLALASAVMRQLATALSLLGIDSPEKM